MALSPWPCQYASCVMNIPLWSFNCFGPLWLCHYMALPLSLLQYGSFNYLELLWLCRDGCSYGFSIVDPLVALSRYCFACMALPLWLCRYGFSIVDPLIALSRYCRYRFLSNYLLFLAWVRCLPLEPLWLLLGGEALLGRETTWAWSLARLEPSANFSYADGRH